MRVHVESEPISDNIPRAFTVRSRVYLRVHTEVLPEGLTVRDDLCKFDKQERKWYIEGFARTVNNELRLSTNTNSSEDDITRIPIEAIPLMGLPVGVRRLQRDLVTPPFDEAPAPGRISPIESLS